MPLKQKIGRTLRLVTPHWLKRAAYRRVKKHGKPQGEPVTGDRILRDLRKLGVEEGDSVMAHVALSAIGPVEGGPNAVVDALLQAVGSSGNLLMPAFPQWPADPNEPVAFDVRNTPTNTGAVHEAFRRRAGVLRSLHPTHSVCCLGPDAKEILSGHEKSDTGFGSGTPFDWLVHNGGKILLIGNNNSTLVHLIELRAGLPNTHEEAIRIATVTGYDGREVHVAFKRHTLGERLIRIEDSPDSSPDYVLLQDYCLIPFDARRNEIKALGFLKRDSAFLDNRQRELIGDRVVSLGRIGDAPSALFEAGPFASRMIADLKANIRKFDSFYKEAEGLSRNWNEVQWYYLVLKNKAALGLVKGYRRVLKVR